MITTPVDELAQLLAGTRCLLLDFDGPICAVFAGRPARTIVSELLAVLSTDGVQVPEPVATTDDPFDVLRHAATIAPDVAARIEHTLRAAEIDAASTAAPTPHATAAIDAWRRHGRAVAVVSNNSATAVQSYLDARGIQVDVLVARTSPDPRLLKPDPYLVSTSMQALDADADECALVGDSLSDIAAARRVGVISIGYANKPRKYETLADAGADAVIDDMRTLADAAAVVTP